VKVSRVEGARADEMRAITVAELNALAKGALQKCAEVNDVWVSGEVSNLAMPASGHCYFTLKDEDSEIKCTFFKGARLKAPFDVQENMKVIAYGSIDLYEARGSIQFNVRRLKADGQGQLYLAYEALRKKLEAEGLFAATRKRPLPSYPKRIGVVTSPTGAVIRDILNITARRFPADILLAPAQVQGEGAAASIVKGIASLNAAGVDIIIVGRGGGSLEDLWAFNEEVVARAIYASRVPVISAVGHETDTTIADFVADLRAPTPSAAAELVLRDRLMERKHVDGLMDRARAGLRTPVERMRAQLEKADAMISERAMRNWIEENAMRLDDIETDIHRSIRGLLDTDGHRLNAMRASLVGLNPLNVLERGYAVVQGTDGKVVSSVSGARKGDLVTITLKDGSLEAQVKEMRERK
jgi:exodeoxyribonuclease VII large subunit